MINTDRIVPITAVDLISMYGVILRIAGVDVIALDATTNGQFEGFDTSGTFICSEPVKNFGFLIGPTTNSVIYFVAAYDYVGFTNDEDGEVTTTGDAVIADGRTLCKATLGSGGSVTISKVGF